MPFDLDEWNAGGTGFGDADDPARRGEGAHECSHDFFAGVCRICGTPQPAAQEAERAYQSDFEEAWDDQPDQPASYRNSHTAKGTAWAWYRRGAEFGRGRGRAEERAETDVWRANAKDARAEARDLRAKLAAAEAQSEQLQHLFDECYADKCAAVKAGMAAEKRAAAAEKEMERERVRLAACGVAALGGATGDNDCEPGSYGYSASFQDVKNLRAKWDAAEQREKRLRGALVDLCVNAAAWDEGIAGQAVAMKKLIFRRAEEAGVKPSWGTALAEGEK